MKKTTVSVINPTYNRIATLKRSIDNVLSQTYTDFEIIIVDDASTDKTEEVINNYGDSRITYIQHSRNKGGSAARNTGVTIAKGQYIALLDSDDEWLCRKLEEQVAKFGMVPNDVGLVYSGFYLEIMSLKHGRKKSPAIFVGLFCSIS